MGDDFEFNYVPIQRYRIKLWVSDVNPHEIVKPIDMSIWLIPELTIEQVKSVLREQFERMLDKLGDLETIVGKKIFWEKENESNKTG